MAPSSPALVPRDLEGKCRSLPRPNWQSQESTRRPARADTGVGWGGVQGWGGVEAAGLGGVIGFIFHGYCLASARVECFGPWQRDAVEAAERQRDAVEAAEGQMTVSSPSLVPPKSCPTGDVKDNQEPRGSTSAVCPLLCPTRCLLGVLEEALFSIYKSDPKSLLGASRAGV